MALSVGALALFLCLMHNDVIGPVTAAAYGWVPITALLLFVFTGSLGFLPLPFAMLGEIFPAKIRGWSCGFSTFMATIFSFVAIKIFPMMRNLMGFHNVFTFYAATIAIGTIIMYFWLPETRGKTLEEIEEFFRSGGKAAVRDKAREIMMPELAELENTSVENERLSMRGCRAANGEKATEKPISGPQCPEESMMNKN
jgi:MFS family permease